MKRSHSPSFDRPSLVALALVSLLAWGCTGDTGPAGPQGPPGDPGNTDTHVARGDSPPGVHVDIQSITGASGAGGAFQVGNTIAVKFKLTKDDGSAWKLSEMSTARLMLSGPSF